MSVDTIGAKSNHRVLTAASEHGSEKLRAVDNLWYVNPVANEVDAVHRR